MKTLGVTLCSNVKNAGTDPELNEGMAGFVFKLDPSYHM